MKIAVLYTSYRQFREFDLTPAFYARTQRLQREADLLFHCNNAEIDQAALRDKVEKIPVRSRLIRNAPQQNSGGYPYGQFEAIVDLWTHVDLSQWDWIIHLHPDIFIADEQPLLSAIESADRAGHDTLVTRIFGHRSPNFATDFFAFKPQPRFKAIFESYLPLLKTPIVVPLEALFFIEVHRAGANYAVAPRFASGHYHRDVDALGLLHEHDLPRVQAYLNNPNSRRWHTIKHCLAHPGQAVLTLVEFIGRKVYGKPQDSLWALLSRIE